MISVLSAGPLITVQDLGRPGHRAEGVGITGAMDHRSLRIANILVGNQETAAGIEVAASGLVLRFEADTRIAVTGSNCAASLDGLAVPPWWTRIARKGQILTMAPPINGLFGYVAVDGGIEVAPVLGSRSTDIKGGFGGFAGRALARGDVLPVGQLPSGPLPDDDRGGFGIAPETKVLTVTQADGAKRIRVIPAAEYLQFCNDARLQFWNTNWELQRDSNRIGYRFAGQPLVTRSKELFSHGILPGVIQIPPSGQPVVQMMDANTAGGYPKIGVVITADLGRLAQVRPGQRVRFVEATREEAINAAQAERDEISRIARAVAMVKSARFAA